MTAHLLSNQLELDSISPSPSLAQQVNCSSFSRNSKADGDIPEMIMSASLTSCSSDGSLSSSTRSTMSQRFGESPKSPRSIFSSYWSSPTRSPTKPNENDCCDDEDDLIAGLQTLKLPFEDDDENNDAANSSAPKIVHAPIVPSVSSFDDTSVDYELPAPHSPTRSPRRQILPSPPPPTAMSSSLWQKRQQFAVSAVAAQHRPYGRRQWSSTTALLVKQHPSILRKSRYSCSAIVTGESASKLHHGLRNEGSHDLRRASSACCGSTSVPTTRSSTSRARSNSEDLRKSVSFYSQVSVFEFQVPPEQRKSQKGWSNYFAYRT